MTAYYNEFDPKAAAWLRELIKAGHIADGVVDERSIEDVVPNELIGFTQCHFFAGIGGWSLALRLAGWPDDRSVWTGSCPCQPFSSAGKGGGFADERHLWPAFCHLIAECRTSVVFGEQVAGKSADAWIDLVQADLEGLGYAFGCVPFPSAGVGAPQLRDRNYWVADANMREQRGRSGKEGGEGEEVWIRGGIKSANGCATLGLADAICSGFTGGLSRGADSGGEDQHGYAGCGGAIGGLDNSIGIRRGARRNDDGKNDGQQFDAIGNACDAMPINGIWRNADWLFCTDGKWRPVESGTFPLVDGVSKSMVRGGDSCVSLDANNTKEARAMRLKGYGNAINPEQAKIFIQCFDGWGG